MTSPPPQRRVPRQRGFTLLELMVTLVVASLLAVAMVASMVSPSVPEGRRAAEAVREAFEYARAQATATSLAHRVHITPGDGADGGVVSVHTGTSSVCNFDFGASDRVMRRLELVRPAAAKDDGDDQTLVRFGTTATISGVIPPEVLTDSVCVRPDGTIRNARFNEPFFPGPTSQAAAGAVLVQVQEQFAIGAGGGTPRGRPLSVVVPYSGVARVAF